VIRSIAHIIIHSRWLQRWLVGPSIGLIALLTAACGLSSEPRIAATHVPEVLTAEQIAERVAAADPTQGAAIYAANCTACHGETGVGDGPSVLSGAIPEIVDLTDPSTLSVVSPYDYFQIISRGRLERYMPPWEGVLSEDERWAVAVYVYALRSTPPEQVAQPPSASSAADDAAVIGTISGSVVNGTAGAVVPDGLSVALQTLTRDFQEVDFRMTGVENGRYRFEDVPIRADQMFVVTVVYGERVFASSMIPADPDNPDSEIPLSVFETTDDLGAVEVNLWVTRYERRDDDVDGDAIATQIVSFHNASDRAVARFLPEFDVEVSGQVTLPTGAEVLNTDELVRCCLIADGVLYDNRPLLPGEDNMLRIVYALPTADSIPISYPLNHRVTNALELMIEPGAFTVAGGGFVSQGRQQFSTGTYDIYLADAPAPGAVVSYQLTPAAMPSEFASPAPIVPLLLGAVGGGLMVIALLLYWRLRVSGRQRAESLIEQIADLDARYRSGSLAADRYQRERERLKARLAPLLRQHQRQGAS